MVQVPARGNAPLQLPPHHAPRGATRRMPAEDRSVAQSDLGGVGMEVEYVAQPERIADPLIRRGVREAIERTLLPAATEKAYPGHFNVVADGSHYGGDHTWPGLDSWEMAGAYLWFGKLDLVRGYFDFVRASQR